MKIHYEPHPVDADRKAELREKGYKIIDARFAPADWEGPEKAADAEPATRAKRRGRPKKAAD